MRETAEKNVVAMTVRDGKLKKCLYTFYIYIYIYIYIYKTVLISEVGE